MKKLQVAVCPGALLSLALKSQEDEAGRVQDLRYFALLCDQKAAQPAAPDDPHPFVEGRFFCRASTHQNEGFSGSNVVFG